MPAALAKALSMSIPLWFLSVVKFLILLVFVYLGFEFGREPIFAYPYLWLSGEQNFLIFWFFTANTFYWSLAFGWSAFLAAYAFQLHGGESWEGYSRMGLARSIQQFTLNFFGGMTGWVMLILFLVPSALDSFSGSEKLILFLFVFLGITGYVPYTLVVKNWFPGAK